jgi:hypothetical protein
MLDAFVKIESADDVLDFAQRYGVLCLCEHRLPASHTDNCLPEIVNLSQWVSRSKGQCYSEPIEPWLVFAKAARSTLKLAVDLFDGIHGSADDWSASLLAIVPNASSDLLDFLSDVPKQYPPRQLLAGIVYLWLEHGDARIAVNWDRDEPVLELTTSSRATPTFGVLAHQLALAITRSNQIAGCTGCGVLYLREGRRPQKGRRNYCNECRDSPIPGNDRQRALRSRQSSKKRKAKGGR